MNTRETRAVRCLTDEVVGAQSSSLVTTTRPDPRPSSNRPGVHHLDHEVAVANTGSDVLLTTITAGASRATGCTVTRLAPEQARSIGWALIEAAGVLEVGADQRPR